MFRIRPFEARTISWWHDQRDVIDANPPYQRRGGVWSHDQKGYLIDTILNDFDIPKFYVADFTLADSPLNRADMQYAIIDGKQRFEAIFDFFAGRVLLRPDFTYYSEPKLSLAGRSYRDLKAEFPKIASKFENFNLSVMSVVTDEEAKINELFVRLNSSRPLSAPEFRNAMRGIVPPIIRSVATHRFFGENVAFKTSRGEDRQTAAKFLLVEFRGELVDTKKTQLDRLVDEGARAEAQEYEFRAAADRVVAVLDAMHEIFEPRDPLLSSQGPLVVYYWLARELGADKSLRSRLVRFEEERRVNRERARVSTDDVDADLLRYDALNRSINDVGSLRGRVSILLSRLAAYS